MKFAITHYTINKCCLFKYYKNVYLRKKFSIYLRKKNAMTRNELICKNNFGNQKKLPTSLIDFEINTYIYLSTLITIITKISGFVSDMVDNHLTNYVQI